MLITRTSILEILKPVFKGHLLDFEIRFYGSFAYGKPHGNSDIDILATYYDNELSDTEKKQVKENIYKLLNDNNVDFSRHIDIHIVHFDKIIPYVKARWEGCEILNS